MSKDKDQKILENQIFWKGHYDCLSKLLTILRAFEINPFEMLSKAKEIIEIHDKED
jgi:hypothetical protein